MQIASRVRLALSPWVCFHVEQQGSDKREGPFTRLEGGENPNRLYVGGYSSPPIPCLYSPCPEISQGKAHTSALTPTEAVITSHGFVSLCIILTIQTREEGLFTVKQLRKSNPDFLLHQKLQPLPSQLFRGGCLESLASFPK